MIPIIIVCYNNWKYVKNTVDQIERVNPEYKSWIQIMNNSSDDVKTIDYLETCGLTVICRENEGPWITPSNHPDLFASLPDKFILTDPDLEFHPNLPSNFIEILSDLADRFSASKIGFAISIENQETMYDNVCWRENTYWSHPFNYEEYSIFVAPIDTTFALINKRGWGQGPDLRVAGNFTCKHIPFYKKNSVLTTEEQADYYSKSKYSTTGEAFLRG